jgi:riboflavin synthase
VTYLSAHHFHADVMKETVRRSSLSQKRQGSYVNLERAMRADDRFGGHIVSGHIDGAGTIENIIPDGNAYWYEIKCKKEILDGIVEKGSITIDGISLTVANVCEKSFKVSIIPHTREQTTLGHKSVGDYVNLENDILGKYVQKFMSRQLEEKHELTYEMLEEYGY